MNTSNALTIVIPAKNEAKLLPRLLISLARQDYPQMPSTKVFIADAGSTDSTVETARSFSNRLRIEVIPGGLPSVGRNAGAWRAETPYILFLDADMELHDPTLLRRCLERMQRRRLHCLTTNIWCSDGGFMDQLLYLCNNTAQRMSSLAIPFATGMFMMFEIGRFRALGGFNERALYAEDYLLTKKVSPWRFGIVSGGAYTTNRRFQKLGHMRIVRMFLRTALNTWNEKYFLEDQGYWKESF
jgi:glycosyltransferase involved in cell wall biosynthesis